MRITPPAVEVLEDLIVRASIFVNGVAVIADDKAPALGWLADAEMAMPGRILREARGE